MNGKKKKRKLAGNILLFSLEAVVLFAAITFLVLTFKVTDNVKRIELNNKQAGGETVAVEQKPQTSSGQAALTQEDITVKTLAEEEVSYRNIALFGVDSRDKQLLAGTRTDTIMIASLNEKTKEVKLVSIYRDSFLNIGNDVYNKANAAYAIGGPQQAVEMLNNNLDLQIDDYVTVGFLGLIDTVDAVGGINVEVSANEIEYLNSYQICMAEELGLSYIPVEQAGNQLLNGMQATAYCRIRYTAGDDFKRTQRQRNVLISITEKAKTKSVVELNSLLDAILPEVSTSLDLAELIEILSQVSRYEIVANTGMPFEEYRAGANVGSKGSCIVPYDLTANVVKLHEFLYDETEYKPSETVVQYNEMIKLQTAEYLRW